MPSLIYYRIIVLNRLILTDESDESSALMKLSWGIILFCAFVAVLFVLYLRRRRRKHILASESLSFDLDNYQEELIRTSATVGDSTLKVSSL